MIALMQERPPYIRFELATVEFRDNLGQQHTRDVEHILVTPAGTKEVHVAVADEWIKQKELLAMQQPPAYPPEWAQRMRASFDLWRRGVEVPVNGTPVRSWPVLSPSEVKRCIDANVLTVEDLAVANEPALQRLGMGARGLKDKAVTWISERDGPGKAVQELAAIKMQNEELGRQLAETQEVVRKLGAKLSEREPKRARREAPEAPDDRDVIQ